jgi:outer membrane usher protein FimD/PapC
VPTAAPRLEADTSLATAGYYQLSWTADASEVKIEESAGHNAVANLVYEGPDRATLLSGLADGRRTYRAGAIGADGSVIAWSEPVTVTVDHHPLSRALTFFAIGAIVFFATLVLIISGARRDR